MDGVCLVKMQDGVELLRQARVQIVTVPFRLWPVDHADGALQVLTGERCGGGIRRIQRQQEAWYAAMVEGRFNAAGEGGAHPLAFGRRIPVGGGRDGAVVGSEADQHGIVAVGFARPTRACSPLSVTCTLVRGSPAERCGSLSV